MVVQAAGLGASPHPGYASAAPLPEALPEAAGGLGDVAAGTSGFSSCGDLGRTSAVGGSRPPAAPLPSSPPSMSRGKSRSLKLGRGRVIERAGE